MSKASSSANAASNANPAAPAPQTWNAELYDRRAPFVSAMAGDLVELLAPQPGERVLDLGCGTGELAAVIAAAGAHVTCLDASPEMVAAARARLPGATFRVADAQALDDDAAFDAIFSNAVLHWMRDPAAAACGMARALRPGGRLVAELGGRGCIATVCEASAAALRALGEDPAPWFRWYFPSIGEYATLLEQAGLAPRVVRLYDRATPVQGDDGLAAWLRIFLVPLVAHLGARWDKFVGFVEDMCRPTLRRPFGWELDYVRLRVVAYKPA
jgi:trans-aconitate methyltransferase